MAHLGIDIGGTKVVLAVGDAAGLPIRHVRRPTRLSGNWRDDLQVLVGEARGLLEEAGVGRDAPLESIGVSVPGPADPARGLLINPPNLAGWENVPIGGFLADAFGVVTHVENDANAAVLAEAAFGAGQGIDDLLYLTMSTGVGGGLISGGRLVRGAFGSAGEAGHLPIEPGGAACACGLRGCLEAYVGGEAWRERLRRRVRAEGRIAELAGGDPAAVRPEHLVTAAREGDGEARAEFDWWLDHLARGLVPMVMLLEPRRIVLGTIAAAAGEALCFEPLRARLKDALWAHQAARLEVVPAGLGDALPQRAGLAVALEAARRAGAAV